MDRALVLKKHDTPLAPPRGILRRDRPDGLLVGRRTAPSEALAPFVHHFWAVEWDLETPFTAESLAHPAVSIVLGARSEVLGVRTERSNIVRAGRGRTFGITFRPATFQAILGASVSTITDAAISVAKVFGRNGWTRAVRGASTFEESVDIAEGFLAARLSPLSRDATTTRDICERMMTDSSLLRASDVAHALSLDLRTLQRRFRNHVGVSPKWVIQRYRLHEAAAQLGGPKPPPLAVLAASLGYADQAHFARDFKRVLGQTPAVFAGARDP